MATDTNTSPRIKGVFCPEPPRVDEYGWNAQVGQRFNDMRMGKVTRIEERHQNLGTYGIVWYDVYCRALDAAGYEEEETLVASFNASQVEVVTYFTPGKDY